MSQIQLNSFIIEGNNVFTDKELRKLIERWENSLVSSTDLQAAAARITQHYIDHGYVTSGALLPDQEVDSGNITLSVLEGHISGIDITGNEHLRKHYYAGRLATGAPLNIAQLEESIQLLQRHSTVGKINAHVTPSATPGENLLQVKVEEDKPYSAGINFNNGRPPSIGEEELDTWVRHDSLLGWGDQFEAHYTVNDGPDGYRLGYTVPVNDRDTSLSLAWEKNDSLVIEEPFEDLDIESRFKRASIALSHPFIKTLDQQLDISLGLEWRNAETFLLNQPFSFSAGVDNGETTVTLVHFTQEWIDRAPDRLFAIHSDIRWGVDLFDATTNSDRADGRYLGWVGQAQWIQGLSFMESRLITRGVAQVSDDALLPSEKIAVGGMYTVRGYRENLIVTDMGFAATLEWQVPVWQLRIPGISTQLTDGQVTLASFIDYGMGHNDDLPDPDDDSVSSVGLGILWQPSQRIGAQLYWGYALENVPDSPDDNLQDDGIHFSLGIKLL